VPARRFRAQNDPSLINTRVLFAIFITMSTSSPLFRKSCATRPQLFAHFPTLSKSVSRAFLLLFHVFFLLIFHGTDPLLINALPSSFCFGTLCRRETPKSFTRARLYARAFPSDIT
jgi:hypothetical protein